MLVEDSPVGVVSIAGSVIEDLYILPDRQRMGLEQSCYGTQSISARVFRLFGYLRITKTRKGFIDGQASNQREDE